MSRGGGTRDQFIGVGLDSISKYFFYHPDTSILTGHYMKDNEKPPKDLFYFSPLLEGINFRGK